MLSAIRANLNFKIMKESRIIIMLLMGILLGVVIIATQMSSVVQILNEFMIYD